MPFAIFDSPKDPFFNLALEETLCHFAAEENEPVLFLWQNPLCCVIGRNQNPWLECSLSEMERAGALLVRRKTGGGAVVHDGGNLNFSFCMPSEKYDLGRQLSVIVKALSGYGICAEVSGRNDLTVSGRKFSGNAFRHSESFSLHHGTLLINSELGRFGVFLTPDEKKLRAKGVRSVSSRVANLSEFSPEITVSGLCRELVRRFEAEYGKAGVLSAKDFDVSALSGEYASDAFRFGKTPAFSETVSLRCPSGGITVGLSVEGGHISDCAVWSDSLDAELPQKLKPLLLGKPYSTDSVEKCIFELLGETKL